MATILGHAGPKPGYITWGSPTQTCQTRISTCTEHPPPCQGILIHLTSEKGWL